MNKFEQVSSDGHQMSPTGGVPCLKVGMGGSMSHGLMSYRGQGWGDPV